MSSVAAEFVGTFWLVPGGCRSCMMLQLGVLGPSVCRFIANQQE